MVVMVGVMVDVIAADTADADNLSLLALTVQWVAWSDDFPRIAMKIHSGHPRRN